MLPAGGHQLFLHPSQKDQHENDCFHSPCIPDFVFCHPPAIQAQPAGMAPALAASLAAFNTGDCQDFAAHFMKKAELIDATGQLVVGRKAIREWRRQLIGICPDCPSVPCEVRETYLRHLGPALAVAISTVRVGYSGSEADFTFQFLLRRLDGKWYVETCTIIPLEILENVQAGY